MALHIYMIAIFALLVGAAVQAQQHGSQRGAKANPYAPEYTKCPPDLKIRDASKGLSKEEKDWRELRGQRIIPHLRDYLKLAQIDDFDVSSFIDKISPSNVPVVGLSVSGGGTQSGFGGLGIWQAFDARYEPARQARTAGLSQVLSYISALSGGAVVTVSTLIANNFGTVDDIRKSTDFSVDFSLGPTGNVTEYLEGIFENAGAKAELDFPVTVADTFGQFWGTWLPEDFRYADLSGMTDRESAFAQGEAPMPAIAVTEIIPGTSPEIGKLTYPGRNETNGFSLTSYEFTPFEFGSWAGGRVQAFMPTRWIGSAMSHGRVQNSSRCVAGYDKLTLIEGTTADAFTAWFIDAWYGIPIFAKRDHVPRQESNKIDDIPIPPGQEDNPLVDLVNQTASLFETTFNESLWATYPNPFQDYNDDMTGVDELLLIDGSLVGETNPIRPLIIPDRKADLVIVYEASSDSRYNWINGTNLINSAKSAAEGNIPFPKIPTVDTLVKRNLTIQPSFFGCDTPETPLVLYLPNAPWTSYSNFSYAKSAFSPRQVDLTLENAFQVATYGNGSVDPDWPACVACAVIKGALARVEAEWPSQCRDCFKRHCWDGKETDEKVSTEDFDLRPRLDPGLSFKEWNETEWST